MPCHLSSSLCLFVRVFPFLFSSFSCFHHLFISFACFDPFLCRLRCCALSLSSCLSLSVSSISFACFHSFACSSIFIHVPVFSPIFIVAIVLNAVSRILATMHRSISLIFSLDSFFDPFVQEVSEGRPACVFAIPGQVSFVPFSLCVSHSHHVSISGWQSKISGVRSVPVAGSLLVGLLSFSWAAAPRIDSAIALPLSSSIFYPTVDGVR